MLDKDINQIRISLTASLYQAFYTDFMPMIQQVKNDVLVLNISERDEEVFKQINEELKRAENLLKQIKNLSDNMKKNDEIRIR